MPEVIETTVYKFEELDETAKERARDWYREASGGDNYWAEYIYDDLISIAALMGIEINTRSVNTVGGKTLQEPCIFWSGFSSQGDGACFEARLGYKKGCTAAVKAYAPKDERLHRIAAAWTAAQRPHGYNIVGNVKQQGRYSHEYCTEFEFEHREKGWDYHKLDAAAESALIEPVRDLMRWTYRQLEKEYEYQNSDEQVDESIEANEYTFTAAGRRFG
jgi:hypothetical protein